MSISGDTTYLLLFTKYAANINPATTNTASKPGNGLLAEPLDWAEEVVLADEVVFLAP
jgi:hypothetical protein